MADPEKLATFRRAAEKAHPNDPARVSVLIDMECRFLDSQFSADPDQDFQLLRSLFADRSMGDMMEWTALRFGDAGAFHGTVSEPDARSRLMPVVIGSSPDVERERAIYNERVKLNANLFNALSGWAFGAGGVGIAANSVLGSAPHRWLVTVGILAAGALFGGLLKWLANREVGKLR